MARNSIGLACAITLLICALPSAQNVDVGRKAFVTRCASCHGTDGNGGELGPAIAARAILRTDDELRTVLRTGFPAAGMPPFSTLSDAEAADLVAFVRTLKPRTSTVPVRSPFTLSDGRVLDGLVLNRTHADVQVLDAKQRIQLLRPEGSRYRAVTSQADWPSYNGGPNGSRYSALTQIDRGTVERLAPKWLFTVPNSSRLQVTPVVVGGVMYVTNANECWALDAGSGREIWRYQRPRTKGLIGNAAGGINRGVGVAGDRVFMVTDHAHVIALDRHTGALLWDTEMADWRQNYNATGAPLPVGNLVITGTSGGDEGVRGFVAACL